MAVVLLAVTACSDGFGPSDIRTLSIDLSSPTVSEGGDLVLPFTAVDAAGQAIPASEVTWATDDPTTALVDGGIVRGVAPGLAAIELSARGLTDRVALRVGFGALGPGEIALRVQGERGARAVTGGRGTAVHQIGYDELGVPAAEHESRLDVFSYQGAPDAPIRPDPYFGVFTERFPADTVLWVSALGAVDVGTHVLRAIPPRADADGLLAPFLTHQAMLRIQDPGDPARMQLWVAVDEITLTVEEVELSNTSQEPGRVRGFVTFEAAGLLLERQPHTNPRLVGSLDTETRRIYGEFDAPVDPWRIGTVRYVVHGGGFGGASTPAHGPASAATPGRASGSWLGIHSVSVPEPGYTGSGASFLNLGVWIQIDPGAPELVADAQAPAAGSWVHAEVIRGRNGVLSELGSGVAVAGRVTVVDIVPPTTGAFGWLRARLEATVPLFGADGEPTGEELELDSDLVLTLTPECALRRPCS